MDKLLTGRAAASIDVRPKGTRLRCTDCGHVIPAVLRRLGSLRCHDCRMPQPLRIG